MSLILPNLIAFLPYAYVIPEGTVRSQLADPHIDFVVSRFSLLALLSRRSLEKSAFSKTGAI